MSAASQRSMRYFGQKLRFAEALTKQAKQQGISPRLVLGCLSTTENGHVKFREETALRLGIKEKTFKLEHGDVDFSDVARDVLCSGDLHKLYRDLIPKERLAVDFSSPNIAKPFHVGHLGSTILGNFICNLKRSLGDEVVSINYLGDWGTQFGILCTAYRRFGDDCKLTRKPLEHLLDVYVKGNRLAEVDDDFRQEAVENFAKLEAGDKDIRKMWWNFRDVSLKEYFKLYAKLGIKFDVIQGEAVFHQDALELISQLKERGLLKESEGLSGLYVPENMFVPLVKSNGCTLYLTRDICAAIARKKQLDVSTIYYVVDNGQTKHFSDLQKCLQIIENDPVRIVHVKFSRISGLSTRKGQVVLLEDLLIEAQKRTLKGMEDTVTTRVGPDEFEKTAQDLALAALYVNSLKTRRLKPAAFDWEKCFSLKGDSGISLQNAHARLCSLRTVNQIQPFYHEDILDELLQDANVREAILVLAKFEESLLRADAMLEPCEVVIYMFRLAHAINRMTKTARVKQEPNLQLAETRLLLYVLLQQTLAEGLRLIGVRPLQQM